MYWNIKKKFVRNKYLDINTLIDDVIYFEKVLAKQIEKKLLSVTYLVNYLNNTVIALID